MNRRHLLVALFATVLTIHGHSAAAQAPGAGQGGKKRPTPKGKVVRLGEMKVEGHVQKPQAMFLMPRANLNYGEIDLSQPLVPKIKAAVEKAPF